MLASCVVVHVSYVLTYIKKHVSINFMLIDLNYGLFLIKCFIQKTSIFQLNLLLLVATATGAIDQTGIASLTDKPNITW